MDIGLCLFSVDDKTIWQRKHDNKYDKRQAAPLKDAENEFNIKPHVHAVRNVDIDFGDSSF